MSDLEKAMTILMERKKIIVEKALEKAQESDIDETRYGIGIDDSEARQMFMGTDLDADEATEKGSKIATIAILGVVSGQVDSVEAMTGVWVDGLMTGCILKDLMARKDRADDHG